MTVLIPNASGALFGLYYTAMFAKHNSGQYSLTPYYAGSGAIIAAAAGMALTLPPAVAANYIGLTGCTLAVVLMASPLATVKTVIKDKNTAAMPFATSLATLLNAVSWSGYGWLVAKDMLILAPNILGLASAIVQLSLFAKYGLPPSSKEETSTSNTSKNSDGPVSQ